MLVTNSMFDLTKKEPKLFVWQWVVHYLIAVVIPQLVTQSITRQLGFHDTDASSLVSRNLTLRNQELLEYCLLFVVAGSLGLLARSIHPSSVRTARRVWIVPVFFFCLTLSYDLFAAGFSWTTIVSTYFISLPGDPVFDEPWDGYSAITFPVWTAVVYGLCSLCRISRGSHLQEPE